MRRNFPFNWIGISIFVLSFGPIKQYCQEAKPAKSAPASDRSAAADETPIGPKWWPSEWGADDQRGAANRLTPEKVLQATQLIRTGKIYSLGRLYEFGMPLPGKRHFSLTIPGMPTGVADGKNHVVHNDELLSTEIGQVGTQLDGLGHFSNFGRWVGSARK